MPAPTNISFETATDVGALPATISQNVRFGGVNYTVYYKITPSFSGVIGVYGKGDPFSTVDYQPRVIVYDQTDSLFDVYLSIDAQNIPLQMPVTAGTTYYFYCLSTTGNTPTTAVLSLNIQREPLISAPAGSIAINDDNSPEYPLALLSEVDGSVLKFITPFPGGEQGHILPNGRLLVEDINDGTMKLFDCQYNRLATVTYVGSGDLIISSNRVNTFYHGNGDRVFTVSQAGVAGATSWTLATSPLTAMAPNLAGTILYYATTADSAVRRHNLSTDTGTTNLAAAIANYVVTEMILLADGTLVVSYQKKSVVRDYQCIRYSTAGAVLNTYAFGTDTTTVNNRLAHETDDPVSFLVWIHQSDGVSSTFKRIKVSDGTELFSIPDVMQFESALYAGGPVDPPLARFGHSNSCPCWVIPFAVSGSSGGDAPVLLKLDTDKDGLGGGGGGGGSTAPVSPTGGGYTGLGGDDDGDEYAALVKTRTYPPGGSIGVLGDVAHQQQPLLIARDALAGTTISLTIDRDRGLETDVSSVSLTAAGSETRVIRKFEDAGLAEMSLAQFQLGDAAATTKRWSLDRFQIKPTRDGDR